MEPDQISRLLDLLEQIATRSQTYTITGAADWPILIVIGVILGALLGAMWTDLRAGMKENKIEWKAAIKEHKEDSKNDIDNVWSGMRDCKNDCCPSRRSANREG